MDYTPGEPGLHSAILSASVALGEFQKVKIIASCGHTFTFKVPNCTIDFGILDPEESGSHDFTIMNHRPERSVLAFFSSSDLFTFPRTCAIDPSGERSITVHLTGQVGWTGTLEQTLHVHSSDFESQQFSLTAYVGQAIEFPVSEFVYFPPTFAGQKVSVRIPLINHSPYAVDFFIEAFEARHATFTCSISTDEAFPARIEGRSSLMVEFGFSSYTRGPIAVPLHLIMLSPCKKRYKGSYHGEVQLVATVIEPLRQRDNAKSDPNMLDTTLKLFLNPSRYNIKEKRRISSAAAKTDRPEVKSLSSDAMTELKSTMPRFVLPGTFDAQPLVHVFASGKKNTKNTSEAHPLALLNQSSKNQGIEYLYPSGFNVDGGKKSIASQEEARVILRFEGSDDADLSMHFGFVAAVRSSDQMFSAVKVVAQTIAYHIQPVESEGVVINFGASTINVTSRHYIYMRNMMPRKTNWKFFFSDRDSLNENPFSAVRSSGELDAYASDTIEVTFTPTSQRKYRKNAFVKIFEIGKLKGHIATNPVFLQGTGSQVVIEGLPDYGTDIDFGNVPVGEVRCRSYDLFNSGIDLETVIVDAPRPFAIDNPIVSIEPNSFSTVTIKYKPQDVANDCRRISFFFRDRCLAFSAHGNAGVCNYLASTSDISFGLKPFGTRSISDIMVTNTGSMALDMVNFDIVDDVKRGKELIGGTMGRGFKYSKVEPLNVEFIKVGKKLKAETSMATHIDGWVFLKDNVRYAVRALKRQADLPNGDFSVIRQRTSISLAPMDFSSFPKSMKKKISMFQPLASKSLKRKTKRMTRLASLQRMAPSMKVSRTSFNISTGAMVDAEASLYKMTKRLNSADAKLPPLKPGDTWHLRVSFHAMSSLPTSSVVALQMVPWQSKPVRDSIACGDMNDENWNQLTLSVRVSGSSLRSPVIHPRFHDFGHVAAARFLAGSKNEHAKLECSVINPTQVEQILRYKKCTSNYFVPTKKKIVLSPGAVEFFEIEFRPRNANVEYCGEMIFEDGCREIMLHLTGTGSSAQLRVEEVVDFGTIKRGTEKVKNIILLNDGRLDCNYSVKLESDSFELVDWEQKSGTIAYAGIAQIAIRIRAGVDDESEAKYGGMLEISYEQVPGGILSTAYVQLHAAIGYVKFKPQTEIIDFGLTMIKGVSRAIVSMSNHGNAVCEWYAVDITSENVTLNPSSGKIDARGTSKVIAFFEPPEVEALEGEIILRADGQEWIVPFRGRVGVPQLVFPDSLNLNFETVLVDDVKSRSIEVFNAGSIAVDFELEVSEILTQKIRSAFEWKGGRGISIDGSPQIKLPEYLIDSWSKIIEASHIEARDDLFSFALEQGGALPLDDNGLETDRNIWTKNASQDPYDCDALVGSWFRIFPYRGRLEPQCTLKIHFVVNPVAKHRSEVGLFEFKFEGSTVPKYGSLRVRTGFVAMSMLTGAANFGDENALKVVQNAGISANISPECAFYFGMCLVGKKAVRERVVEVVNEGNVTVDVGIVRKDGTNSGTFEISPTEAALAPNEALCVAGSYVSDELGFSNSRFRLSFCSAVNPSMSSSSIDFMLCATCGRPELLEPVSSCAFGKSQINEDAAQSIELRTSGNYPVTYSIKVHGDDDVFAVEPPAGTIPQSSSDLFVVQFRPAQENRSYAAKLEVQWAGDSFYVDLSGEGAASKLAWKFDPDAEDENARPLSMNETSAGDSDDCLVFPQALIDDLSIVCWRSVTLENDGFLPTHIQILGTEHPTVFSIAISNDEKYKLEGSMAQAELDVVLDETSYDGNGPYVLVKDLLIEPQTSRKIHVAFLPSVVGEQKGRIIFRHMLKRSITRSFVVSGSGGHFRMRSKLDSQLRLGLVAIGSSHKRTVTLVSEGDLRTRVQISVIPEAARAYIKCNDVIFLEGKSKADIVMEICPARKMQLGAVIAFRPLRKDLYVLGEFGDDSFLNSADFYASKFDIERNVVFRALELAGNHGCILPFTFEATDTTLTLHDPPDILFGRVDMNTTERETRTIYNFSDVDVTFELIVEANCLDVWTISPLSGVVNAQSSIDVKIEYHSQEANEAKDIVKVKVMNLAVHSQDIEINARACVSNPILKSTPENDKIELGKCQINTCMHLPFEICNAGTGRLVVRPSISMISGSEGAIYFAWQREDGSPEKLIEAYAIGNDANTFQYAQDHNDAHTFSKDERDMYKESLLYDESEGDGYGVLHKGEKLFLRLAFSPNTEGHFRGQIRLLSNVGERIIEVNGEGAFFKLAQPLPEKVDCGSTPVFSKIEKAIEVVNDCASRYDIEISHTQSDFFLLSPQRLSLDPFNGAAVIKIQVGMVASPSSIDSEAAAATMKSWNELPEETLVDACTRRMSINVEMELPGQMYHQMIASFLLTLPTISAFSQISAGSGVVKIADSPPISMVETKAIDFGEILSMQMIERFIILENNSICEVPFKAKLHDPSGNFEMGKVAVSIPASKSVSVPFTCRCIDSFDTRRLPEHKLPFIRFDFYHGMYPPIEIPLSVRATANIFNVTKLTALKFETPIFVGRQAKKTFYLENVTEREILYELNFTNDAFYCENIDDMSGIIGPNQEHAIEIYFRPPDTGLYIGSMEVSANDVVFGNDLQGQGIDADVSLFPPNLDFGFVGIGFPVLQYCTIINSCKVAIDIEASNVPLGYRLSPSSIKNLEPKKEVRVAIELNPTSSVLYSGTTFFSCYPAAAGKKRRDANPVAMLQCSVLGHGGEVRLDVSDCNVGKIPTHVERKALLRIYNSGDVEMNLSIQNEFGERIDVKGFKTDAGVIKIAPSFLTLLPKYGLDLSISLTLSREGFQVFVFYVVLARAGAVKRWKVELAAFGDKIQFSETLSNILKTEKLDSLEQFTFTEDTHLSMVQRQVDAIRDVSIARTLGVVVPVVRIPRITGTLAPPPPLPRKMKRTRFRQMFDERQKLKYGGTVTEQSWKAMLQRDNVRVLNVGAEFRR